jgi:hypothetical protein
MGRPVDTTKQHLFPDHDFVLPVVLCVISEGEEDGLAAPQFHYVVRDAAGNEVGGVTTPSSLAIMRGPEWPPEWPVRIWAGIGVRFRVEEPGAYEVSLGLDDQEPVRFVHLVLREDE